MAINEQQITDAQLMNYKLDRIDEAAWRFRDEVAGRIDRVAELSEQSGVQPDILLARIITRTRVTLSSLESALARIEAKQPRHLEAAE